MPERGSAAPTLGLSEHLSVNGAGLLLVVLEDEPARIELVELLRSREHAVIEAADVDEAWPLIEQIAPDLIVCDWYLPGGGAPELLQRIRSTSDMEAIPVVVASFTGDAAIAVEALELGGDDYIDLTQTSPEEMLARIGARLVRPPTPVWLPTRDVRTGLLTPPAFWANVERELRRPQSVRRTDYLAALTFRELPALLPRADDGERAQLARSLGQVLAAGGDGESATLDGQTIYCYFTGQAPDAVVACLEKLAERIAGHELAIAGARVYITPAVGYVNAARSSDVVQLAELATDAATNAAVALDLQPVEYEPWMRRPRTRRPGFLSRHIREPFQLALTVALSWGAPFALYLLLFQAGIDISWPAYLAVVAALVLTSISIWIEALQALRPPRPPDRPATPYPPASAIIAAYLPNEAAIVLDTVEAFLRLDYPAPLQIILAYNSPLELPVEAELRALAAAEPRFLPLRVEGSTSKAQNINAALGHVSGEMVGLFDADHQPRAGSFQRAWCWLSHGYEVVQGHCVIRNGVASWLARVVAVEFEVLYGLAHPGRTKLHRFGIFGGSNGYWQTSLLRETRMRGTMLTEDIDSSIRVLKRGRRITTDARLISEELAPTTIRALWSQRMRWAQGWLQVSLRHLFDGLRSPNVSGRQKIGLLYLLGWCELYPWLAVQVYPILGFWIWRDGLDHVKWLIAVFLATTVVTIGTGPLQTAIAYTVADPTVRRHRAWFLAQILLAAIFYSEFKNLIARCAHVKHAMRERQWKTTPRHPSVQATAPEATSRRHAPLVGRVR
jgi:cellulose synthase/poly-beta-1,6-N-acetylglucosamine synthase-like glycosyltransferase/DNA-binding response OmpR family regulator